MPFTTLNTIRPMIHPAIAIALSKPFNGETVFTAIEAQAAILIRDMTGVDIPDDPVNTPDWLHLPAAFIIQHLTAPQISELSDATRDAIEKAYLNAISILDRHPKTDSSTGEEILQDKSTSFTASINYLESF